MKCMETLKITFGIYFTVAFLRAWVLFCFLTVVYATVGVDLLFRVRLNLKGPVTILQMSLFSRFRHELLRWYLALNPRMENITQNLDCSEGFP